MDGWTAGFIDYPFVVQLWISQMSKHRHHYRYRETSLGGWDGILMDECMGLLMHLTLDRGEMTTRWLDCDAVRYDSTVLHETQYCLHDDQSENHISTIHNTFRALSNCPLLVICAFSCVTIQYIYSQANDDAKLLWLDHQLEFRMSLSFGPQLPRIKLDKAVMRSCKINQVRA